MKKELYDSLTEKERMMYDELHSFSERLSLRIEEIVDLLKTLVAMADDPT